jgi:hypothetical protein
MQNIEGRGSEVGNLHQRDVQVFTLDTSKQVVPILN